MTRVLILTLAPLFGLVCLFLVLRLPDARASSVTDERSSERVDPDTVLELRRQLNDVRRMLLEDRADQSERGRTESRFIGDLQRSVRTADQRLERVEGSVEYLRFKAEAEVASEADDLGGEIADALQDQVAAESA